MARIKITPERVRQVAGDFKRASEESRSLVSRLQGTMKSMEPEWEGMTRERFYNEFQTWQSEMHKFVALLNDIGGQLDKIAERFETADRVG